MKKFILVLLAFIVILTLRPLFHVGLFDVHDPTSAFRVSTLVESIQDGQFPAAWNNHLNFGFGYPLHFYYAPLFTYLGAVFAPLVSAEIAVKVTLVIASFVGTYGIYYLLSSFGPLMAGLSAVAFTLLPYRASALYVRGSYSEFLAMSLLPWVIYFWTKPQNNKKTILLTSLSTALFVLSHNTLPILLVPIILMLFGLYQTKFIKGTLLTLLTTFGLVAWFIVPVFMERSLVQVESVARLTNYRDHFLYLSQLWSSPWGYGGSGIGIGQDHMSFMIGKGQLLLALMGGVTLIALRKWRILLFYSFTFFFYIFLSLPVSSILWDTIPMLSFVQFPWRTLSMIGVGVSALSGLALLSLPKKLQTPLAIVLTLLLIYTNLRYFTPQDYRTYSALTLSNPEILDPLARDKIPEYLPAWMPEFPSSRVDDGFSRTATKVYGEFVNDSVRPLMISTAYMPQWRLLVDGQTIATLPTSIGSITTDPIGMGQHSLSLTWHRTQVENISLGVSIITLMVMIGLLLI